MMPMKRRAFHDECHHVVIEPSILYFGTPVVLLTTENSDGTFNLAPMSSAWALGQVVVLGLGTSGQTLLNLRSRPDVVINLPGPELWTSVEKLAPLTGRSEVPESKRPAFRSEREKFKVANLHHEPSLLVRPPRVAECIIQLEARVRDIRLDSQSNFCIVQAVVLKVHASSDIVVSGTNHVDPAAWSPLIYNFRHYFGLGEELGRSFRSET